MHETSKVGLNFNRELPNEMSLGSPWDKTSVGSSPTTCRWEAPDLLPHVSFVSTQGFMGCFLIQKPQKKPTSDDYNHWIEAKLTHGNRTRAPQQGAFEELPTEYSSANMP